MATIPAKDSTNHWLGLNSIPPIPLWLNHFHFVRVAAGSTQLPQVVHGHQLSVHAMLRLNVFLTAMGTVDNTVGFLNDHQRRTHEGDPALTIVTSQSIQGFVPQYILEPLRALLVSPLWTDPWLHRFGDPQGRGGIDGAVMPLRRCVLKDLPRDSTARTRWLAECLASLNSLRQRLIRMGHEHFLDFMICATRLESPPYEFPRTEMMLSRNLVQSEAESPLTALYFNAYNTVMDYQYRHSSNQAEPHLESILEILLEHLVTLLRRLADFQMTSPHSNVSLPHDLSLYFLKPYFVRFKSAVFIACDKWWLCSCLTMELISSHVHSDSTGQILKAMWEVVADQRTRFHTFSSPLTPTHPSQCMLEALRQITEDHRTISIIPLVQSAILSHASQSPQFQEFLPEHNEMKTKIPAYPTLAREDPSQDNEEEQTLSILEMCLIILARFISALDSQPYKMQETLSILSQFELSLASICFDSDPWTPIGVSRRQQLGFARSWTAALERESLEGVQATMVEIIVTCPLLQMYWDQSGTGFRWLDDDEATRVFVEGIDIAERREDITSSAITRLATIRKSLMTPVDPHDTQVGGGSVMSTAGTGVDLETKTLNVSW